jgi:branched-chain amino acid transport system permease protein
MAEKVTTRVEETLERHRVVQLPVLDSVLWLIRIAAIVLIVYGAYLSLSSGRLTGEQWRRLIVIGVAQGSVYSLIALGYTMVYGVLRFINFAHGEVFMIGAMTGFFVSNALAGTVLWTQFVWGSLLITMLACAAVSMSVAILLERVAYRPLRGMPRLVPFITAIGASFFLQYTVAGLFGTSVKRYPPVPALSGSVTIGGFLFQRTQLLAIIAAAVMMGGLYLFVERTRTGKAMRAVAEDQETAQLMGINVDRTIATVFAVGGAMAGAGGFLFGLLFQSINFFSGFFPGISAFTAAVLGGIGNIVGAMLGGLTLGTVESGGTALVLGELVPSAFQLSRVVAFVTLILVLVFRPSGILGERLAEERG